MMSCPSTSIVPPVMSCSREKQRTKRRFARAGQPHDDQHLALVHVNRDVLDASDVAVGTDLIKAHASRH